MLPCQRSDSLCRFNSAIGSTPLAGKCIGVWGFFGEVKGVPRLVLMTDPEGGFEVATGTILERYIRVVLKVRVGDVGGKVCILLAVMLKLGPEPKFEPADIFVPASTLV